MSWKKHFRTIGPNGKNVTSQETPAGGSGVSARYSSYLPEVYAGHPSRIQRYYQYDDMDRDSDINAALDTIADFCTQSEEQNDEPFEIIYNEEANETEVTLIKSNLKLWVKLNDFKKRLWHIFRGTIKNGDSFFLVDPETYEWLWVDHFSVEMVKVDETKGKEPDEYIVRGLDINRQAKFATRGVDPSQYKTPFGTSLVPNARPQGNPGGAASTNNVFQLQGANRDLRQQVGQKINELSVIDAQHMVHLSLSVGMDVNWPFGSSILEPIFKIFKQKELLEDSIIIYRVMRAPERRVFKIDVGSMPPIRAKAHIEMIKNEIHQRRIPNRNGGGNSVIDAAYNPLCLCLTTRIPLLDGRTLPLSELISEYQAGKENWVYSCDPITGEIMPGNITWAGITRKNAQVMKLTLDNGETLTVTPDHKIPVLGKGFVEAKDLTPDDSLVSYETRLKNIDGRLDNERTYTQIYDHKKNAWVYVHRMVGEFFRNLGKHQQLTFLPENIGKEKTTIHHKDFNRYNNDPRNLTYMNKQDHLKFHEMNKKEYWKNITEEEYTRITTKISNSLKEYYYNMSEEDKKAFSEKSSVRNSKWMHAKKENDPKGYREWHKACGKGRSKFLTNNPEAKAKLLKNIEKTWQENRPNATFTTSQRQLQLLVETVKSVGKNRLDVMAHLSADPRFGEAILEANPVSSNTNNKIDYKKLTERKLTKIIKDFNYKNWKDFVSKSSIYNHRIVSIELLEEKIDTGTITIDGNERWHKNHTFATESGIFVKNSIVDDYFFAQGLEGRGSSVEVLPGGDNLGEIGDLSWFSKKMARGLRIPTSYLSLGDEESGSQGAGYNDGKLGAAVIQEFRFNKTCMRLQALLSPNFDEKFKEYLKGNGIEIESSLFELRFNPPQNFTKWRQIEIDSQQVGVYQQVADNKKMSERFKFKRYLNWSEDEILENERMWAEENADKLKNATGETPADSNPEGDLGDVGFHGGLGGMDDIGDLGGEENLGGEGGPPPEGGAQAPGPGAGPAPPPPTGGQEPM